MGHCIFYEEDRFSPSRFVHLACRTASFETVDILDHMLHFSPDLREEERADLARACEDAADPPTGRQPKDG